MWKETSIKSKNNSAKTFSQVNKEEY